MSPESETVQTLANAASMYSTNASQQRWRIGCKSSWCESASPIRPFNSAILDRFRERNITFVPNQGVAAIDPAKKTIQLRDATAVPYDLFLGVPKHRVPAVVEASGLAVDGWIPVDRANLSTRFPNVYAVGDVTSAPVPKAGIFAESAARAVAEHLIVSLRNEGTAKPYDGAGSCFIEFGDRTVGRVDVDFLTGPSVVAPFTAPTLQTAAEKGGAGQEHHGDGDA